MGQSVCVRIRPYAPIRNAIPRVILLIVHCLSNLVTVIAMEISPVLTIQQLGADLKIMSEPKYKQSLVDLSIDVPEPVPVLKIGDKVVFTRGSISTIGGMQKSRKTFLVALFAFDFLSFSGDDKVLKIGRASCRERV